MKNKTEHNRKWHIPGKNWNNKKIILREEINPDFNKQVSIRWITIKIHFNKIDKEEMNPANQFQIFFCNSIITLDTVSNSAKEIFYLLYNHYNHFNFLYNVR